MMYKRERFRKYLNRFTFVILINFLAKLKESFV
jgi:hypothetical protein